MTVLAVVPVIAFWGLRLVDVVAGDFFEGPTTFAVGSDFSVLFTAATLVAEGEADQLYDFDSFQSAYREEIGRDPAANAVFAHPPIAALPFVPLTVLSWQQAFVVWLAVSGALLCAVGWLLVRRAALGFVVASMVTVPTYLALMMGQLTMAWLTVFAGIAVLARRTRDSRSGLAAAILVLKPTLLIGIGLWWLFDRNRWRALAVLFGSSVALVVASMPFVGASWLDYPGAAFDFAELHSDSEAQWAQFSPWGFAGLLGVDSQSIGRAIGLAAVVIGIAAFLRLGRRAGDASDVMVAASIVLALWASPHVVAYDWALLGVAIVLIRRSHPGLDGVLAWSASVLAFVSIWSIVLGNWTRDQFGWTFQFAVVALAVTAVIVALRLETADGPLGTSAS